MFGHTSLLATAALASALGVIAPAPAPSAFASPSAFAAPVAHAHHVSKPAPRKRPHKPKNTRKRPAPLTCRAAMSTGRPYQFTTDNLLVTTAGGAMVQATANYLTVAVPEAAIAGQQGTARIPYYISLSTPLYTVKVAVTVTLGGRTGACSTSFVPRIL